MPRGTTQSQTPAAALERLSVALVGNPDALEALDLLRGRLGPLPGALLTPADAAAYLGVSRSLFFRLVGDYQRTNGQAGIGPARRLTARTVRFRRSDLDRYAAACASGGANRV